MCPEFTFGAPISGGVVLHSKLVDRRCRVQFLITLSAQLFGVFNGFFLNSLKYALGSLKETLHGGHSTFSPRSHKRTVGLKPTTTTTFGAFQDLFMNVLSEIIYIFSFPTLMSLESCLIATSTSDLGIQLCNF